MCDPEACDLNDPDDVLDPLVSVPRGMAPDDSFDHDVANHRLPVVQGCDSFTSPLLDVRVAAKVMVPV